MSNRFDYVKYDVIATAQQASCKELMLPIAKYIEAALESSRAKALALTKLEEAYMWIGKAIRDDQIDRNGSAPRQEERKDG